MRTMTVGLMADPGLPEKLARSVAEDLPRALSEHSGPDVSWEVEASRETPPLTFQGKSRCGTVVEAILGRYAWASSSRATSCNP